MAVLEVIATAQDNASPVLQGIERDGTRAAKGLQMSWAKAAAGLAAAGAAMEAMARRASETNEAVARLEHATGIQSDAIRNMARELADVTLPYSEVIELMAAGREQGLKSAEQLGEFAKFWDMVSDATGIASDRLTDAAPALRAVGIEAGQERLALEAFGYITQETTGDVAEFMRFLERTGPELREFGLDINDAAAMLGAMERELGMSGRMARQEFRQGVREADGDLQLLLETLGLSAEQFKKHQDAVSESGDTISNLADIFGDHHTIIQRAAAWVDTLTNHYSEQIEVIGGLGGVVAGAAAFFIGLMMAGKFLWPVLKGIGAAILAIKAPVWIAIGAIGGLIWWLNSLGEENETVTERFKHLWIGMKPEIQRALDALKGVFESFMNWLGPEWETFGEEFIKEAQSWIAKVGDLLKTAQDAITRWSGVGESRMISADAPPGSMETERARPPTTHTREPAREDFPGEERFEYPEGYGIRYMHTGGTFRAPNPGGEGLVMLQDQEKVVPRGSSGGLRSGGGSGGLRSGGGTFDFGGLFDGANISMAGPDDAERISELIYGLFRSRARAEGK